jgi:hypothetical protein
METVSNLEDESLTGSQLNTSQAKRKRRSKNDRRSAKKKGASQVATLD